MCIESREALTWWTLDPLALTTIGSSIAVYTRGLVNLWRSAGVGAGIGRREAAAFYAGQLSLLLALVSPIDRLSDLLFSAHMTQHEILLVVAPPLIVLGEPLVILLVHGGVVWLWHIPAWFEAALRNEWIHAVQHASFFVTAVVFWWG